jgi:hypothetical protein
MIKGLTVVVCGGGNYMGGRASKFILGLRGGIRQQRALSRHNCCGQVRAHTRQRVDESEKRE